ncbi:hypothetical protein [Chitinophaga lutea]|uniref:hypothetical protein n=1 Tax=Chitinophaga lutea TaxID=2488634 RepID=UPI0013152ECA|nr:hypothetical protein [Chitinophaga lutea]
MKIIVCQLLMQLLCIQMPQFPAGGSFSSVFQVFRNPGAMADVQHPAAGLYTERRFLLKEMNVYALALGMPVSAGVLGFKLWQFGFPLYREQLAGLGYALPLGERLRAAVCLNYRAQALEAELGLVWKLTKELRVGLHCYGPGGASGAYTASVYYLPAPGLRLEGEWRKEAQLPLFTRVQCLYRPADALWLLAGFSAAPPTQFAGAAFRAGRLQVGVTGSYHLLLGITPGVTLVWGRE